MAAYTTIDDSSAHFQTVLYTGNGSTQNITNDGNSNLQPDLVWTKARSATSHHTNVDSSRGAGIQFYPNLANAEETVSGVSAFLTDGFSLGSNGTANASSVTHVAWQWKANAGTTVSVTESGNNPGGTHQANTTSGFSIVTYTGTGATGTVTHGLGVAPNMILVRNRDVGDPWAVYYGDNTDYLVLDTNAATVDAAAWWNDTSPSSTVFTVSTDHSVNADGEDYSAYCFAEKQGFSKFGSYVGNSNDNGTFVYLGFKPRWLMIKSTQAGMSWDIIDSARSTSNVMDDYLTANTTDSEGTSSTKNIDFLSNGFKCRDDNNINFSDHTYTYMAFAENPFVTSTGIPTTAR